MTPFWTPFLPRRKKSSPSDLPLQARVSTLESEMLVVLQSSERTYGVVKKLQGKVYRGVQLGDTVDADPAPTVEAAGEDQPAAMSPSKADLYKRAAQLRRH